MQEATQVKDVVICGDHANPVPCGACAADLMRIGPSPAEIKRRQDLMIGRGECVECGAFCDGWDKRLRYDDLCPDCGRAEEDRSKQALADRRKAIRQETKVHDFRQVGVAYGDRAGLGWTHTERCRDCGQRRTVDTNPRYKGVGRRDEASMPIAPTCPRSESDYTGIHLK